MIGWVLLGAVIVLLLLAIAFVVFVLILPKAQCSYEAQIGHSATSLSCTRRKGHDGQHHNVIYEVAWKVKTVAEQVPYISERDLEASGGIASTQKEA